MRILFVHKQILFPRDTGGKIRVLNLLPELATRHDMTYLCNLRQGEAEYLPEMARLGLRVVTVPDAVPAKGSPVFYSNIATNLLFSSLPFPVSRNYSRALADECHRLVKTEAWDLLICDTIMMAPHTLASGMPVQVLFQHNVESQILRRHADAPGSRLRAAYMSLQWKRMRRFEAEAGRKFKSAIAVSIPDRDYFKQEYGWDHVDAIDTAVDLQYFRPGTASSEREDRVVFVGSMDWLPNQQGAKFFVKEVWPHVRRKRPNATFWIVGRQPPASVARLDGHDGVKVAGKVPDVRPYLEEASVVVVPILVGGGTRIKIFESMAMGKAVVSTSVGAEGLPVTHRENILLADQPAEFANAVIRLLEDPAHRKALGSSGLSLVQQKFGTGPVARQFERLCERTVLGDTRKIA